MRKALRIMAILAAFGLTAWIGVVALAQSSPTQAPATTDPSTASGGDEFKGNCDEAEHANDPECQGVTLVPEDNEANEANDDRGENENADDPDDDVNDDDVDEEDQGEDNDDNSGPSVNSGPGSANSGPGSDNSGHGGDDDEGGED